MLFQPPMCQQNKGEGVFFYPIISMYIYLHYLYSLCMFVFYLSVFIYKYMTSSRQWEHRCIIWGTFFGKKAFCLLTLLKQMPLLTISNKNIFFKTQGNRLGAIVAPSKIGPGISTYEYKNNCKYTYKHTHN